MFEYMRMYVHVLETRGLLWAGFHLIPLSHLHYNGLCSLTVDAWSSSFVVLYQRCVHYSRMYSNRLNTKGSDHLGPFIWNIFSECLIPLFPPKPHLKIQISFHTTDTYIFNLLVISIWNFYVCTFDRSLRIPRGQEMEFVFIFISSVSDTALVIWLTERGRMMWCFKDCVLKASTAQSLTLSFLPCLPATLILDRYWNPWLSMLFRVLLSQRCEE